LNSNFYRLFVGSCLSVSLCAACLSLPKSNEQVQAKYSHTELSASKHYLAYSGVLAMTLETANEKWLAKAEKLCKSREFEYEFDKEEFRGKDFSENKYPYIEGKLFCTKTE
jgi:hypothetical protein